MKLNYHPPHLILVHFPAALLPMDWVCAALGWYTHNPTFTAAAYYALAGGVAGGWLAVAFGFMDLLRIPAERPAAQRTALLHAGINTGVLIGYSVLFFLQWRQPMLATATVPVLLLKTGLLLALVAGNYLGAQLVLKYRLGTIDND
ncbi:conserved hypothetical protein [Hymenobacter roseosalivarius DSM 11622]|uniref:DUF2231 domain-containing protein n=1 Tax=Hymenobacter roseosalivarius DSM 11622 TaxID=645990 RepID=A0A1W1UGA4_9BACT|nr:DUF2231 domain-containing protein [Hymenobacter roseosalivarius]SMB80069.1 conserved hypothetical protein [Hymenobacter roseosalivarius DSM 11622]